MAKITTNADKVAKDFERVRVESVKMYGMLAQNIFDQMAIDSTGNMRIMGGGTTGRNLWRSLKTNPPLPKTLTSRSGRIVASLNNKNFRGKNEAIRKIDATAQGVVATYGSIVPYAKVHDQGGLINIPAHTRTSKFSAIASRSLLTTRETIYKFRFAKSGARITTSKNSDRKRNIVSLTYKVNAYSVKMPPRPYVSDALKELPEKLQKLFDMAFNKTIGRIINVP